MSETLFLFKQFQVVQEKCAMKINTDGVLLGSWVNCNQAKSILDIGTGSGVIALMLSQRSEANSIVGVEIDEPSYLEAKENMENSPWKSRLNAVHSSIQDFAIKTSENFDLIVSNPPFFSGGTLSATQNRSLVKHTIKLPHNDLLRISYQLLSANGNFAVVLPYLEGLRFIEIAEQYRLYCTHLCEVSSFPETPVERLLINFSKKPKKIETQKISIRDETKAFSLDYISLTKEFYLKM